MFAVTRVPGPPRHQRLGRPEALEGTNAPCSRHLWRRCQPWDGLLPGGRQRLDAGTAAVDWSAPHRQRRRGGADAQTSVGQDIPGAGEQPRASYLGGLLGGLKPAWTVCCRPRRV